MVVILNESVITINWYFRKRLNISGNNLLFEWTEVAPLFRLVLKVFHLVEVGTIYIYPPV